MNLFKVSLSISPWIKGNHQSIRAIELWKIAFVGVLSLNVTLNLHSLANITYASHGTKIELPVDEPCFGRPHQLRKLEQKRWLCLDSEKSKHSSCPQVFVHLSKSWLFVVDPLKHVISVDNVVLVGRNGFPAAFQKHYVAATVFWPLIDNIIRNNTCPNKSLQWLDGIHCEWSLSEP